MTDESKRAIRVWLGVLSGRAASSCCYFLLANLGFAHRLTDGDLEVLDTSNILTNQDPERFRLHWSRKTVSPTPQTSEVFSQILGGQATAPGDCCGRQIHFVFND